MVCGNFLINLKRHLLVDAEKAITERINNIGKGVKKLSNHSEYNGEWQDGKYFDYRFSVAKRLINDIRGVETKGEETEDVRDS